ncbi:MAG TPA: glutamate 5-kinase [Lentisphaerae bacterium]|nr:glutamate 5-kinase [Lentisphaerota bacterium]
MKVSSQEEIQLRSRVAAARRIVVKVGTRVLMGGPQGIKPDRVRSIVTDVARLKSQGRALAMVSSGAIGCGMAALGIRRRPTRLPELQMAAAVGQTRLMATYQRFFSRYRILTAQLLLTHDDLRNRQRHLNARNTLMALLRRGTVPIINENDVVAVDEIKVGDNDFLAALVAMLISADLLVLLTTTNGVRRPQNGGKRTVRVPVIRSVTPEVRKLIGRHRDHLSVGGMETKLEAAQMAASVGIPTVIADGRRKMCLQEICSGAPVGTLVIGDSRQPTLPARKRWIAFFNRPQGTLVIDEGARDALRRRGRSLLPIGVREVRGDFPAGAVVDILDPQGNLLGRGLVDYSSEQIRLIKGKATSAIPEILGTRDYDEVIHRDNMMLFDQQEETNESA